MGTMFNQVFEFALVKMPTSVFVFVLSLYKRLKASGKRNEETRAFTILYEDRWEPVLKAVFAVVIVVWVVWKFFWLILFTSIIGGSLWLCLRKEEREESEMKKQADKTTFYQIIEEEEVMQPRLGNRQNEISQSENRQLARSNGIVSTGLLSELAAKGSQIIGNGAGDMAMGAEQTKTIHPDGTDVTHTRWEFRVSSDGQR